MRASDLTDDDIGRSFLVPAGDGRDRRRIVYEGRRRPVHPAVGDPPHWLILLSSPVAGVMWFRDPDGRVFSGVFVRSSAEVVPLEVDYAVSADGEIVETRIRAA